MRNCIHRHCEERSDDLSAVAQRAKAEAIQTFPRRTIDCFASLAVTENTTSRSRGSFCPRFAVDFPYPPIRGRRECRVRAAPAVSCAKCAKNAHTSIQVQRRHPTFPAQWLYGLYRALPGEPGFLATVAPKKRELLKNLTPASGRQDHATLPYASAPFVKGASTSTASHPAFVTIAKRPSYRDRTKSLYS
jgi:hypothetical protein